MNFKDIKQYPSPHYAVDVGWDYLEDYLDQLDRKDMGNPLILRPEYQRGYVWEESQKIAYCEYIMRGGESGRSIYLNCTSWQMEYNTPIECVDGQQRIGAVLDFLHDKIRVFGRLHSEFDGNIRSLMGCRFRFHVCTIKDRKELVEWYISMNTGGSVHTKKDLLPAYNLLKKLTTKQ